MDYTVGELEAATTSYRKNEKSGNWRGIVLVRTERDGVKARSQITKTFTYEEAHTKNQAKNATESWHRSLIEEARRRAEEEARRAEESKVKRWTLTDYAAHVIGRTPADDSTKDGYRKQLRRLERAFPGVALGGLTADMVADWQESMLEAGLSPVTVRNARAFLNLVMRFAVEEDELIDRNPCKKRIARAPKLPHKEPNALGADERGRLLDYLERAPYRPARLAAHIAVSTGMRVGEICGLRWKDVDLDRSTIYVHNSIGVRKGGTYEKEPKTGASLRMVYLPDHLVAALKRRRAEMWEEWAQQATPAPKGEFRKLFVIGATDGSWCHPGVVSRDFHGIADTLELMGTQGRRPTFHDLRHTYITAAITDANADIKTVASMVGHSKVSHTLDIYASADPDAKARLAAAIDEQQRAEREAARLERERREREEAERKRRQGQVLQLGTGTEG